MTNRHRIRRNDASEASVTSYLLNPTEGGQACRVGRASGHDCGVITDHDVVHSSPAPAGLMWVDHTVEVDFDSLGGDSGGPYFYYPGGGECCNPVRALGTHVHSLEPGPMGWFSPYYVGRTDYNNLPSPANHTYDLCLTPSC